MCRTSSSRQLVPRSLSSAEAVLRCKPIPLAPLPEQHRIVAEIETQFTRLEAGVAALKRAQANLRRYKASVLKAACEGRLVPTEAELARAEGRDYEPADVLLERILAERRARWEAEQWEKEIERAKKKAAQAKRKAAGLPARIRDLSDDEWQDLPEEIYGRFLPKNDKWKQKYKEPEPPDTVGAARVAGGVGVGNAVSSLAFHVWHVSGTSKDASGKWLPDTPSLATVTRVCMVSGQMRTRVYMPEHCRAQKYRLRYIVVRTYWSMNLMAHLSG